MRDFIKCTYLWMISAGDAEWESVTAKVGGTETIWKDMNVRCYIAAIDDDPSCSVASGVGYGGG